jgi:hypothetical protein
MTNHPVVHFEIGCRDGYLLASGLLSQTGSYGREQLIIGKRQFEDEALALDNPREEIIHFDRDDSWEKEVQEFITAVTAGVGLTGGATSGDARSDRGDGSGRSSCARGLRRWRRVASASWGQPRRLERRGSERRGDSGPDHRRSPVRSRAARAGGGDFR